MFPLSVETKWDAPGARDLLAAAAREAGDVALAWFRPGGKTTAAVQSKAGGSPVTEADFAADAYLKRRLGEAFPEAGWLSEETPDSEARLDRRALIVVDPIDGTRAFIDGDPRWTVAVALIVDGRPLAGVVHAPALGETYAAARGAGAHMNGARLAFAAGRARRADYKVAGPKPLLKAMGDRLGATLDIRPFVPSLAYRMCMAASGALDFAVAGANSQRLGHRGRRSPHRGGGRTFGGGGGRKAAVQSRPHPARRPSRGARGVGAALARSLSRGDRRGTSGISRFATFARLAFRPERGQIRATQPSRQDSRGHPP